MNSSRARQSDLLRQARAVLDLNRTGSFTKPALRQYPHQWSWDSAFIAMGYARYDQSRAEQELRSLPPAMTALRPATRRGATGAARCGSR